MIREKARSAAFASLLLAILSLVSSSAHTWLPDATREFTAEDIVAFKSVVSIAVSPDRRSAIVALRSADLDEHRLDTDLWLVPLDGGAAPRQLTFAEGSESSPAWSPDGERVAFLARRGETTEVHVLPLAGGESRPFAGARGSAAAFAWAPDGRRMAIVAPPDDTDQEARRRRERDDAYPIGEQARNHRVWIVTDAGVTRAVGDSRRHAQMVRWSPDGKWIAAITTPTPEADATTDSRAEIIDVDSGREREVPDSGQASSISWTPEGVLLVIRPFDGRSISREDVFAWTVGAGRAVNVTRALDRDAEAVVPLGEGRLAIRHATGTTSAIATFDINSGSIAGSWTRQIAIGELAPSRNGWVFVGGQRPDELQLVEGDEIRTLTSWNEALARSVALPEIETVSWRGPAGAIDGVLFRPADLVPGRRYPLILNPHGGPRSRSSASFDPVASYFVSQGFLVLKPNFRGSVGYGDQFARANVANWGDGPFRDVMAGVDALVARGIADPARLFMYGWSYGGYLTNWAVTHTDRFRAAVSGAGVADLRMQYAISDARRWRFDYFTGTPFVAANLPIYERESPVTWVRAAKTPTLFLHGERDVRCPLPQGLMMYRALADNGVKTEMIVYPREGHGFAEPRHIIDRARRIVDWFRAFDTGASRTGPAARR